MLAILVSLAVESGLPTAELHSIEKTSISRSSVSRPRTEAQAPDVAVPILHALGLMGAMRLTETFLWPLPFAEYETFGEHYQRTFTEPPVFDSHQPFMRWDGDSLAINVVGHGLFGSELYLRARQCRLGWAGSLLFAGLSSAVWEYAFEGSGVRPSAQDLVYTPLAGLVLGEARYLLHGLAQRATSTVVRRLATTAVDPFGEVERAAGTGC